MTLTSGPFTNASKVVLKFYHNYNEGSGWEDSVIKEDKMTEVGRSFLAGPGMYIEDPASM